MRNRFSILALSCILTGCAAIRGPAPTELMQECPYPLVDTTTNKGIAKGLVEYHAVLKQCNLDKKGLRLWATESSQ